MINAIVNFINSRCCDCAELSGLCRLEQALSYADLSSVTHVDLSSNRLTELPPSLDKMVNLESLDLSDNKLELLPKSILEFKKLQYVVLHGNDFASIIDDGAKVTPVKLLQMRSYLFK